MKLALEALTFVGPTCTVVLLRLKANLENSCFIPLYKQVQTCSGLALVQTGSNLFESDLYKLGGIQNFAQSYKDHQIGKVKIRTPCHLE